MMLKQSLIAAAIAAMVLTGCNREEETTVVPETSSVPSASDPVATTPDTGTGSMGASPSTSPSDSSMPSSSDPASAPSTTEGSSPSSTPPSP